MQQERRLKLQLADGGASGGGAGGEAAAASDPLVAARLFESWTPQTPADGAPWAASEIATGATVWTRARSITPYPPSGAAATESQSPVDEGGPASVSSARAAAEELRTLLVRLLLRLPNRFPPTLAFSIVTAFSLSLARSLSLSLPLSSFTRVRSSLTSPPAARR